VDPSSDRGASWAAAGLLAPVTEAHYGEEALLALNLGSAGLYPEFIAELEDLTGSQTGYRQTGTLIVARDADDSAALHDLNAFQERLGLETQRLTAAECRNYAPGLSPRIRGGIFVGGDHQVDNRALLAVLRAACERCGVEFMADRVVRVGAKNDRVGSIDLERGGHLEVGCVVVTAGSWSTDIGLPKGAELPLRPVKGQLLHLKGPSPILAHNVRGLDVYLVPRADGRLVVGATVEEQGLDLTPTAEAAYLLLRDAYEILPGVLDLELTEQAVGLRPATPDNAPVIGPSAVEGLIFATGHFRNGVLLAPITAEIVASLLSTGELPVEAQPFSPLRFIAEREKV
jgi:glycine oxidase